MLAIPVIRCQYGKDSSTVTIQLCSSSAPERLPWLRGHPACGAGFQKQSGMIGTTFGACTRLWKPATEWKKRKRLGAVTSILSPPTRLRLRPRKQLCKALFRLWATCQQQPEPQKQSKSSNSCSSSNGHLRLSPKAGQSPQSPILKWPTSQQE